MSTQTPAGTAPRVALPLWLKLAALSAALAVIPTTLVGLRLIRRSEESLRPSLQSYQISVTEELAQTFDGWLVSTQRDLNTLALALTNTGVSEEGRIELARAILGASKQLDHASVYDATGALIDTLKRKDISAVKAPPSLEAPLLKAATGEHNVAVGEPAPWEAGGAKELRALVVVPIKAQGEVTGYLASYAPLTELQERVALLNERRVGGEEAVIFVIDGEQRLLAHSDPARALAQERQDTGIVSGADAAFRNGLGVSGTFTDAGGRAMFGALKPLTPLPWAVGTELPEEVAFGALLEMRRLVYSTIAVSVLLSLAAALLLARRITTPIRALVGFAGELAARRFSGRVRVKTRDELAVLGSAMSQAAAELEASEAAMRKELAIRSDLGRYLPKDLVELVVRREQDMRLGGERRQISVLFADVVSFTPLAERLAPDQVVAILNQLFTILTEIIFRHGGTVDKIMGDCVMAFWGAPRAQEDHAARALAAAEDMIKWLEIGNANWQKQHGVTIELAIGVNSGEALVGNIGSETRMEYTAIGDTVNIAARLEACARPNQILLSRATREAAGEAFELAGLGEKELPGRAGAVEIFELQV